VQKGKEAILRRSKNDWGRKEKKHSPIILSSARIPGPDKTPSLNLRKKKKKAIRGPTKLENLQAEEKPWGEGNGAWDTRPKENLTREVLKITSRIRMALKTFHQKKKADGRTRKDRVKSVGEKTGRKDIRVIYHSPRCPCTLSTYERKESR